jgi:hypothetical protein
MISDKEKKKRQHEKELKSLRNKMGSSIVWFDALTKEQQYDLLFYWKREKFKNKRTKPEKKILKKRFSGFVNGRYTTQWKSIEVFSYPTNFKYFIKEMKPRFSVSIKKMREAQLRHLLENGKS